jgi:hypothetical protein
VEQINPHDNLSLPFPLLTGQDSEKAPTFQRAANQLPITTHEKFATFLNGDGFKSVLLLENLRPDLPITFRPSLILSAGEVPLDSVTVPAHSTATVDINSALSARGYSDERGTIAVRFDFSSYGPGSALVEIRNDKHHVFLNSYAQSPEEYWRGTGYDAVIWAPEGTQGFASITNSSLETQIIHTTFLVKGLSKKQPDMQIAPRQTKFISIDDLLAASQKSGAGIHIEYEQQGGEKYPGVILVEGQLFNNKTGFTKHIRFIDKDLPLGTGTLRTHFLLLGRQPIEDNFPSDTSFRSMAALRNVDSVPTTVTPTVKFLRNGSVQTVDLPSRLLVPTESWIIDFKEEQKAGHLPLDFNQGSLVLTPDTGRPSIVAELFNLDDSGSYVVGPSLKSYPARSTASIWRTDGSFQTTIMVENTAGEEDRVSLRLYSGQSTYKKTFSVAAGSLLKINVRDLQQNAIPDDDGHLLLDTSGVVSLTGSHNTRSKLSYDEVIHSTNQSDYIGYTSNPCDFVMDIWLYLYSSSGSQPFSVGQTTDWSISGPEYGDAGGTMSSDSSIAQVSNDGSGDMVTFTPPDDGLTHTVTFTHDPEVVMNCVACSFDDVRVSGISVSTRTLHLVSSTCQILNGFPTIFAGWEAGNFACALSDTSPKGLLPDGGSCAELNGKNCYVINTPACQQSFCPGDTRVADGACTHFIDKFPITKSSFPVGCSN